MVSQKRNARKGILILVAIVAGLILLPVAFVAGLYFLTPIHSRSDGTGDAQFDISPDGNRIVFSGEGAGRRDIYVLDVKTSRVTQVTNTPDYEGDPAFSPDGKSIVYVSGASGDRADHVFTRDLTTGKSAQLTREDYNDSDPSYSPDGRWIVFSRNVTYRRGGLASNWGADSYVIVMRADGSGQMRLPAGSHARRPRFTSDSKRIAFSNGSVCAVDNAPSAKVLTFTRNEFVRYVTCARNSNQLAFVGYPNEDSYMGEAYIAVMTTKAADRRNVITHRPVERVVLAPDAKSVYFTQEEWPHGMSAPSSVSLWQVGVDGKGLRKVASEQLFTDPLHWKP
jgi:Tol biopolymer transport system component